MVEQVRWHRGRMNEGVGVLMKKRKKGDHRRQNGLRSSAPALNPRDPGRHQTNEV